MKHYMDITHYKEKFFDMCHKGDMIEIQEKIDGANFSFKYNAETDTVEAFSSRQPLSPFNTLRGAYEFVNKLDKEKVKEVEEALKDSTTLRDYAIQSYKANSENSSPLLEIAG